MKSYTSLAQSKKLAQILPLESADMWWAWYSSPFDNGHYDNFPMFSKPVCNPDESVPCWSLAALLGVIPQELFGGEYIINITEGTNYKWIISYEPQHPDEISSYIDASSDNLIDCCVEMILKLKDRNIL